MSGSDKAHEPDKFIVFFFESNGGILGPHHLLLIYSKEARTASVILQSKGTGGKGRSQKDNYRQILGQNQDL
jgi:hypothetical protein